MNKKIINTLMASALIFMLIVTNMLFILTNKTVNAENENALYLQIQGETVLTSNDDQNLFVIPITYFVKVLTSDNEINENTTEFKVNYLGINGKIKIKDPKDVIEYRWYQIKDSQLEFVASTQDFYSKKNSENEYSKISVYTKENDAESLFKDTKMAIEKVKKVYGLSLDKSKYTIALDGDYKNPDLNNQNIFFVNKSSINENYKDLDSIPSNTKTPKTGSTTNNEDQNIKPTNNKLGTIIIITLIIIMAVCFVFIIFKPDKKSNNDFVNLNNDDKKANKGHKRKKNSKIDL